MSWAQVCLAGWPHPSCCCTRSAQPGRWSGPAARHRERGTRCGRARRTSVCEVARRSRWAGHTTRRVHVVHAPGRTGAGSAAPCGLGWSPALAGHALASGPGPAGVGDGSCAALAVPLASQRAVRIVPVGRDVSVLPTSCADHDHLRGHQVESNVPSRTRSTSRPTTTAAGHQRGTRTASSPGRTRARPGISRPGSRCDDVPLSVVTGHPTADHRDITRMAVSTRGGLGGRSRPAPTTGRTARHVAHPPARSPAAPTSGSWPATRAGPATAGAWPPSRR